MYYLSPLPQFLIHSHELALDSSLHYFGLNYSPLALSSDLVWNFDVRKTGMPSVSSCSMQELLAGHKIIDSSVLWNWLVISPNGGSTMIVFGTKGLTFSRESLFLKERLRVFLLECTTTIITTREDGIAVRSMRNSNLNSRTVIVTKKAESLQQKEFRAHQPLSCHRGWHD